MRNPIRKDDVEIGAHFIALVSGKIAVVRIEARAWGGTGKGWWAKNVATDRRVRITTAARLRGRVVMSPFSGKWVRVTSTDPRELGRDKWNEAKNDGRIR